MKDHIEKIIASCYFSFNKLIEGKVETVQKDGINFQKYIVELKQDLRHAGK